MQCATQEKHHSSNVAGYNGICTATPKVVEEQEHPGRNEDRSLTPSDGFRNEHPARTGISPINFLSYSLPL